MIRHVDNVYQVVDRDGNGDGQLQLGEGVTLYMDVTNTGRGASRETQALLRNLTDDGLLLRAGRFDISNMVYHTYSSYDRGTDVLHLTWQLLDRAPHGRDEGAWKDWPHRRDEY